MKGRASPRTVEIFGCRFRLMGVCTMSESAREVTLSYSPTPCSGYPGSYVKPLDNPLKLTSAARNLCWQKIGAEERRFV